MKTTIAYKKHSAGIIYILLTIFGALYLASSAAKSNLQLGIIISVVTVFSAILSVKYLILPSNIIVLSDGDKLILPRSVVIPLTSICDVSYKRATGKGIQYRWGSITITTYHGKFKFGFVADCEDVSKKLMGLARDARLGDQAYNE